MDQARLTKLLEIAEQRDQVALKVLHNAVVSCIRDYQNESTAARLKDWKEAEKALEEKINLLWAQHEENKDNQSCATVADVLAYLEASGWKVTKTSLYRHQAEGKITPAADGTYRQKDVDKYARTWLKQKSTGKRISEKTDELQRKKLELELQNLEIERRRKSFALDRDLDKYVPREQMDIELATRAGVLQAGLRHWVQSRAAEWIRAVAGDMKKVGDLINLMNHDLDEHINHYAAPVEFQVIIAAAETDETEGGEQTAC